MYSPCQIIQRRSSNDRRAIKGNYYFLLTSWISVIWAHAEHRGQINLIFWVQYKALFMFHHGQYHLCSCVSFECCVILCTPHIGGFRPFSLQQSHSEIWIKSQHFVTAFSTLTMLFFFSMNRMRLKLPHP